MMNNGFNIDEIKLPTNKNVEVKYKPYNTKTYTYKVFKDGKIIDKKEVTRSTSTFNLVETGTYKIQVERFENEKQVIEETKEIVIDKEAPELEIIYKTIEMTIDDKLNVMNNIKAKDNLDGDLTKNVTTNYNQIDFNSVGEKYLTYSVTDQAGNTATQTVRVIVTDGVESSTILLQSSMIIIIIVAIVLVLKLQKSIKLEKRIAPYCVKPVKDRTKSFFDFYLKLHNKERGRISKLLRKSDLFRRISKRYKSRVPIDDYKYDEFEIMAEKMIFGILFVACAIVSETIKMRPLNIYEILFAYVFGSIVPDITFVIKSKFYYNKLENDLLQAITIMNNAFKSGRSITQAVSLVSEELEGPIANEFYKMKVELSFGLDMCTVFTRFSERIKLEEAKYLTSSITILNNTGGNITKVFDSIEESLFNKKKIKLEMDALTASSKIILYVLFVVPIAFIVLISMIDPTFFNPFFDSVAGIIFFTVILIAYLLYILVLKKIMKVKV